MKVIFALIIVNIVVASANVLSNVGGVDMPTVYNSIEDFKTKNPDSELIPMKTHFSSLDDSRSYSLGKRQTGDAVVANTSNKKTWPVAQNITTTLSYPSNGGSGAFLTYILINCEQSSNVGQAYVTYGGINQHFIQIVIEARVSTYFNYAAFFYGIK